MASGPRLIPRNGPALAAYYTGIYGLVPGVLGGFLVAALPWPRGFAWGHVLPWLGPLALGGVFGTLALILGINGLRASKDPRVQGGVHAWIGILLGGIEVLAGCAGRRSDLAGRNLLALLLNGLDHLLR